MNILKFLPYLLISISLLTVQFSGLSTAALSLSLSAPLFHSLIIFGLLFVLVFAGAHWAVHNFVFVQILLNIFVVCYNRCKIWSHVNF